MLDVIVVGAGAAGLTAAYALQQQQPNLTVSILEANSKLIGGRLRQDATLSGWNVDVGGQWIHVGDTGYSTPEALLEDFLGRDVTVDTYLDPPIVSNWGGVNDPIMYTEGRTTTNYRWHNSTWWDFFDTEIASNLITRNQNLVLDCVVDTIDYSADDKSITTTCGNTGISYTSKHVIVTVSMQLLKDGAIKFLPDLPSQYKDAMQNFDMEPAAKIFVEFTTKFYPDYFALETDFDRYDWEDCASSDYGERIFWDETYGQPTPLNIMGVFVYGAAADQYVGLDSDIIIKNVLDELDVIFNGDASRFYKTGIVQDWSKEPYVKTGYTRYVQNDPRPIQIFLQPIQQKVYFAGEALPVDYELWGYANGAALSGRRAARLIMGYASSPSNGKEFWKCFGLALLITASLLV